MKNIKKIIILLFLLVFTITYASAAQRVIKGIVVDEQGEPLIGVTIQVMGTNMGTITDVDGNFSLSIPDSYDKIKTSYVGFQSQEITLDHKAFYKIILKEEQMFLNEVVVVGYGMMQKRDITGSISGMIAGVAISDASADKKKAGTTWKRSGMKDNSIRLQVGDNDFIPLESAQMAVQIDGFRVRVLLDCFFFNNKKDGLEGTFKLKLPTDATPYYFAFGETKYLDENKQVPFVNYTPDDFSLTYKDIESMNDRKWYDVREARIVSKQKAAKAYEQTVSANIDPALMEWGGADMFSCRVFPLQMNKLHRIVIGYDLNMTEALDFREYILSLPKVDKNLKVDISLANSPNSTFDVIPLSDSIKNENQHIYLSYNNPSVKEIKIDNNSISPITLVQSDDVDSNDSNDYFASTFRVNLPEEAQDGLATDAVFLLDLSLSSSPDKFNVWLKLMDEILANNSDIIKRFAVLCFDIDNYWYANHFQKNNVYNRDMFFKYANTLALEGATNVGAALKEASNPSWLKKNTPKHIFVMSDGDFNWGEVNKHTFKTFMYKGDKVHTYKTGLSGTNVGLLDYLSRTTNGFSFTVTGEEEAKQTAKSFRYRPWNIKNIHVDGVKDFLISGSPTQLYNAQKLIFTGRSIPEGNISIEVDNGSETKTLEFDTKNKINSSLASRIYGQIALAYLDNYGYKAEEAANNYSTFYKVPGQYTSFLMLENDYDYDEYAIDEYDAENFISDNLVNDIVDKLEKSENTASLGDPKTVFLRWIETLKEGGIVSFDPSDEFMDYLNNLPDDIFKVALKPIKSSIKLNEQQTSQEQEMLADEDVRFDRAYSLSKKRNFDGDKLKLLSSVVERNASDIQAIRDIAMVAIDWNMGDQAYYMMKRIIDWRQGEALAYFTAAQALAKSGNIDMAIVYYYICLNSDWDSSYGDFESIVALECLKFLNKITDSNFKLTKNTSDFLLIFKKEVEELLDSDDMLFEEADIVITASWNVDNTDIDLHVIEPTGEECYYGHRTTEIGGKLTKDVTDGYGPEMYVLEKSVPGTYKIFLNYYRVNTTKTASKAKCYINVYKNWGRKTEKVIKKTIFLENRSDKGQAIELKL